MAVTRSRPDAKHVEPRARVQAKRDQSAIEEQAPAQRIDWFRTAPFILMHIGCLGIFWVGWSPTAVLVAVALYVVRAFSLTAFYHRYFSHRAFKTSRFLQFVFALIGTSAVQRNPLWWAAHHRRHHAHTDTEDDIHSPRHHGFLWSHMGWFLTKEGFQTDLTRVRDFARFPELRWLDRYELLIPVLLAITLFVGGEALERYAPSLQTNGWQLLVWGFFLSTVALYHATYMVNSVCHRFGYRPYDTSDESRNNVWIALITLGEGWHNNHHHFPAAARQGFQWWEIDATYYVLRLLARLGLVWDIKPLPDHVRDAGRRRSASPVSGT